MLKLSIGEAKPMLKRGGVLAYPTEAVYGLGCDPFNQKAVESIASLKGREMDKGFIVLISDWSQLSALIHPISDEQLAKVRATWPGFVTWVFPKASSVPNWITGHNDSIAIRMSAHPVARALCQDMPLLSTSANISGQPPAKTEEELNTQFPQGIDALVQGLLGAHAQPSPIYDISRDQQLR